MRLQHTMYVCVDTVYRDSECNFVSNIKLIKREKVYLPEHGHSRHVYPTASNIKSS